MTAWFVVLAAGAGCLAFRLSFVVLLARTDPPAQLQRLAGFVMPAAFAALAAGALATAARSGGVDAGGPIAAAVVTAFVARRHCAPHALLAGMAVLWVSTALAAI